MSAITFNENSLHRHTGKWIWEKCDVAQCGLLRQRAWKILVFLSAKERKTYNQIMSSGLMNHSNQVQGQTNMACRSCLFSSHSSSFSFSLSILLSSFLFFPLTPPPSFFLCVRACVCSDTFRVAFMLVLFAMVKIIFFSPLF